MATRTAKNKRKRNAIITVLLALLAVSAVLVSVMQYRASVQEDQDSDAQMEMKPEITYDEGDDGTQRGRMNFSAAQAENPDVVAWLTIEGIGVDYPIMQTTDNTYYLTHTAQRRTNKMGALFLDYRTSGDFSDFNSVVYGHWLKSGRMFGQLSRMRETSYFNRITQGTLYTPQGTYRLEIFAAVLAESTSNMYTYIFPSAQSRQAHLDSIRSHAVQYRDIGVTTDDRLLALSTCSYEYEGARTLVFARIAP